MKSRFIIFILIICASATGCSTSEDELKTKDIEQMQTKIIELEKENNDLRALIENSEVLKSTDKLENKVGIEEIKGIEIGDIITTERMELTIKNIELSYDVLPKDTSSFYTHYPADSGMVYIHINTDVKNIQKQNLECDDIMEIEADYNDGYNYYSMTVPEDSSGFTYANITQIRPLETMGIRFLIECPQEVEESDNSLNLKFKIDKQEFKYSIR